MSEYQYYEFKAVDRPLDRTAQEALRSISSRARITATSFTNHYEWGDFRGDPRKLVEQWFDLHLYLANWGARRLMLRLPARLLDQERLAPFLQAVDWVEVWMAGDNLIIDIYQDEEDAHEYVEDEPDRLATLAPLRDDLLSGDLRLFYLLGLTAVQHQLIADEEVEPLPGIGPLTGPLESFGAFFEVDPDLMQAAAEGEYEAAAVSREDLSRTLAAMPEHEKVELLLRVVDGDALVGAELRRGAREKSPSQTPCRTAGDLQGRARDIAEARERAEAERREAARRRQAEAAEKVRRARLAALDQRGLSVWLEIEDEIERRNAYGYDRAMSLLLDLRDLAAESGSQGEFDRRLTSIRARHEKKGKFIERLARIGRDDDQGGA